MSIANIKVIKAIGALGKKIFSHQLEIKVLAELYIKNYWKSDNNSTKNLNFIYLLLNENSRTEKVFWESFVMSYLSNVDGENPFTVNQISNLLELVSNQAKKSKSEEDKKLYDDLIFYISTKSLLKHSSKTHITGKEMIDLHQHHGSIAFTNISEQHKIQLIDQYKTVLTRALLLINGMTPIRGSIYSQLISAETPSKKDLSILKKHNLTKDATKKAIKQFKELKSFSQIDDEAIKNEDSYFFYLEQGLLIIDQLKDFATIFESQKAISQIDYNFFERVDFQLLINYTAGRYLSKKEGSLANLLQVYMKHNHREDIKKAIERSGNFEMKKWDEEDLDLDIDRISHTDPTDIVINAIKYLIKSIEARISVRKDMGQYVTARELALIAGLDSYRTVVNDAGKRGKTKDYESPLYKKAIDGRKKIEPVPGDHFLDRVSPYRGADSRIVKFAAKDGRAWLKDEKRAHPYEEIDVSDLTEEIKLEDIKEIYENLL